MAERTTRRVGAVALVLGLAVLLFAEPQHPAHEDPMDHPAVFAEYAQSDVWIAVHLGEYLAFLLLLGGLIALTSSLQDRADAGAVWARFGQVATTVAAGSFTILQAVDGIALKRAVDAWMAAPPERQDAAFAAAEAIRWIEQGVNALSYALLGLSLVLIGVAVVSGSVYPRWLGWLAAVAGLAFIVRGMLVAYRGFVPSISGLAALALFGVWALAAAHFMWRDVRQATTADI